MPKKRLTLKSEYERLGQRVKVWMWLAVFLLWVAVGIGAIALLAKLVELALVKMGW